MKKNSLKYLGYGFAGVLLVSSYFWDSQSARKVNSFSFATITSAMDGIRKNVYHYEFNAGDVLFEDVYQSRLNNGVYRGNKYILVYDSLDYNNNAVLFSMPYYGERQLDSLRHCCNPSEMVSAWDY